MCIRDQGEFVGVGFDDVDPDHGAGFLEVFGKLVGVEVGVGQDAVDVAAGASHGLTVLGDARRRADPVGVFRYGGTTGRPDGRVGFGRGRWCGAAVVDADSTAGLSAWMGVSGCDCLLYTS